MLSVNNNSKNWNPQSSETNYTNLHPSLYCRKQPNYPFGKNHFNKKRNYQVTNKKTYTSTKKGNAVRKTHERLRKCFREFNIRHVKKVFGKGLVRVCCRTYDQIANIIALIRKIAPLIKEIGMPLNCTCNMKSIVMFIQPLEVESSPAIEKIFKESICGYNVRLVDIEDKISNTKSQESGSETSSAQVQNEAQPRSEPETEPDQSESKVRNPKLKNMALTYAFDVVIILLAVYLIFELA
jgi:hypothetical protein